MGRADGRGDWPPSPPCPREGWHLPLWEAILTASVLRQGSVLAFLSCFWPRTAFRMKTGKALASSSSSSPTQCWPPSESWDSCGETPEADSMSWMAARGAGGSGSGTGSGSLAPHWEAGRIMSRVPGVAPKCLSPGPGETVLRQAPALSSCTLRPAQGWMVTA